MKTYIKLAWYSLKKNPFFSFIILFGISITIMMILFVGSILETGYGNNGIYKNIDNILVAKQMKVNRIDGYGYSNGSLSYNVYKDHISKMKTPEIISITKGSSLSNLYYKNLGLKVTRQDIDGNFTKVFPLKFILGRPINKDDLEQKRSVVIISEKISKALFGDTNPLGKKIKNDSKFYEIIGVVETVNKMKQQCFADIYIPYLQDYTESSYYNGHNFLGNTTIFLKYKNKEDLSTGKLEYSKLIANLPINEVMKERSIESQVLTEKGWLFYNMVGIDNPNLIYVYISIVSLIIMFIPALSLINLNVTRTAERSAEMGIRKAFGASSLDLIKQLLIENIFTSIIGGVIGVIFTYMVVFLFNNYGFFGEGNNMEINFKLLLFGLLCTLIFSVLSGFYPALKTSNFGIINSLKNDKQ